MPCEATALEESSQSKDPFFLLELASIQNPPSGSMAFLLLSSFLLLFMFLLFYLCCLLLKSIVLPPASFLFNISGNTGPAFDWQRMVDCVKVNNYLLNSNHGNYLTDLILHHYGVWFSEYVKLNR